MTSPTRPETTKEKVVKGVQPKPAADIEVGVSSHLPWVTPYKNAWEALRDEGDITVNKLQAMRKTDGQARALYRLITLPIRAALKAATFVPGQYVDGGEEEAEFIEQLLTLPASAGGMTVPFGRVIAQMLLGVFDGFSAFEMVYWSPDKGPLKGKWTLKKLAHRPSETLTFILDDKSEFEGLRQQTMYHDRQIDVMIPGEHAIYYASNEEEKPFYGQSYFHSAFYHWDKKFKLYVISHIAAQRAAVGTRVGTMPLSPPSSEKEKFKAALAQLGVAQHMSIPENYKVESLKEGGNFDFLAYINHHNSQMSKSILAAFYDKEQGGGDAGKLVDFGTQSDAMFLLMLQTIMSEIEEVVNQKIIPRFIDWNFNNEKYPVFRFGSLSDEQRQAMLDLYTKLATAGQSYLGRPEMFHELEKQTSEIFGLEIDWDQVEEEIEEEKLARADMVAQGIDPDSPPGSELPDPNAPSGPVNVDPAIVPDTFTLTAGGTTLTLTENAARLLDAALDDIGMVGLVRGRAHQGFKRVQTEAGARVYGVPIGTKITRDIEARAGKEGVEGSSYGSGTRKASGGNTDAVTGKNVSRQVHGGGKPGTPQDYAAGDGHNRSVEGTEPAKIYGHPQAPGVQLLDFGDGTVAIRDADGNTSPRQKIAVTEFTKLGWKVGVDNTAEADKNASTSKSTSKDSAAGK